MRDKVLAYALVASIAAHLVIFLIIGKTANARPAVVPTEVETKLVQVEVIRSPDASEPAPEPVIEPQPLPEPEPERVRIPDPERDEPQPRKQEPTTRPQTAPMPTPAPTPQPQPPSNSERDTNLGSTSNRGENLGESGRTPVGRVPSPRDSGRQPTPTPEPAPRTPAPPSPPPDVDVRVCVKTGLLPNQNCENTASRFFRPGQEPSSRCGSCQPKHVSTLADRARPEMESGKRRPDYPITARSRGIEGSVTVEYTINTEGRVVDVKVVSSSGNRDLDKAATDAVTSRRYKPAVQGGIPRNYRQRETFHFHLN